MLKNLFKIFVVFFLKTLVLSSSISPLREGGVIKAPIPLVFGNVTLSGNGIWKKHPHYSASYDVFFTTGPLSLLITTSTDTNNTKSVYCVYDGRAVMTAVIHGKNEKRDDKEISLQFSCDLSFLSFGGIHTVAAYSAYENGASLLGNVQYFSRSVSFETSSSSSTTSSSSSSSSSTFAIDQLKTSESILRNYTPSSTGILGVYYTTYQQSTAQLYQNISRITGKPPITINAVLSSNGTLQFKDSLWKYYPNLTSPNWEDLSVFSQTPALGMYCYYRKRSNESVGEIADCPEASHVLQAHAELLTSAGFEFIAPDATNWDGDPRNISNGADLNQLRPTEIIAEEWTNMRLNGTATPQLSTYDQVILGGVLYEWYLSEFFNNETLLNLDLIFRNRNTERVPGTDKVYIIADEPTLDYSAVRSIQANGGRRDIVTPIMWSAPDASGNYERNGYLKYFSPCVDTNKNNTVRFFSADSFFSLDTPCNHIKSLHSPIGDVWTVSTGLPMNSIPFGGLRYNGLFLKKQFYDIFSDPLPTDILFAPSWNEFAANAHEMPTWDITNSLFVASGANIDDLDKHSIWFDGMTSERSRTIEPSIEDGGYYYDTFASCMRVYRLQAYLGVQSDGLGCDIAEEECCVIHADELFVPVWSFFFNDPSSLQKDYFLTSDVNDADSLRTRTNWKEICSPQLVGTVNSSYVCNNQTLIWSGGNDITVLQGPFVLLSNTSIGVSNTTPFVRCIAIGSPLRHFIDGTGDCIGGIKDVLLGFGGSLQDGLFSRKIRRCAIVNNTSTSAWYTTTDGLCNIGDIEEAIVGYAI
jgi:hypothetical protein